MAKQNVVLIEVALIEEKLNTVGRFKEMQKEEAKMRKELFGLFSQAQTALNKFYNLRPRHLNLMKVLVSSSGENAGENADELGRLVRGTAEAFEQMRAASDVLGRALSAEHEPLCKVSVLNTKRAVAIEKRIKNSKTLSREEKEGELRKLYDIFDGQYHKTLHDMER